MPPVEPYYATIFTSTRTPGDNGYGAMAARMDELTRAQPGFLGIESTRGADGVGITVCYWRSLAELQAWGRHPEHLAAQKLGRERWYASFSLRIAKVEFER